VGVCAGAGEGGAGWLAGVTVNVIDVVGSDVGAG